MIEKQIETILAQCPTQTLVAVTKTVTIENMQRAYDAGVRDFGENRVQELLTKFEAFQTTDVNWHLIGNLQTNKVRYIIDKVRMIQSLNRESLANEIQKQAKKADRVIDCLVEVNIGNEENKHGLAVTAVEPFLQFLADHCPNIRVCGLMAMAPYVSAEATRPYFEQMQTLFHTCQQLPTVSPAFTTLSMGMSHDWQIALEAGSTMIRVGSAIFAEENQ
ncbi:MAG: YggS family pyridoxal phosphate-dependent enzyme [Culicoidibacterales bacterium]